jgi:hypothetical protein
VRFDIYDSNEEQLLETTENTNSIEKVAPFAIKEVIAELPTRLPAGRYAAKYTIYKNDDVAQQSDINVSVAAIGAVPGYTGYGFSGLSNADKAKVIAVVAAPIILVLLLITIFGIRRRRRRNSRLPSTTRIQ